MLGAKLLVALEVEIALICGAERNDGVVAVVATVQKDAHQRPITGRLGQGVDETQFVNGRGRGRAADDVAGSPQETATCQGQCHG